MAAALIGLVMEVEGKIDEKELGPAGLGVATTVEGKMDEALVGELDPAAPEAWVEAMTVEGGRDEEELDHGDGRQESGKSLSFSKDGSGGKIFRLFVGALEGAAAGSEGAFGSFSGGEVMG